MEKRKAILIVCDGMGDRQVEGKTPLQRANKISIDAIAYKGICGLMHTAGRGVRPGSDTAHLSIFGYDPRQYYFGRGVFEALGVGAAMSKGDVAFRGNFATIDKDMNITDRRAGRLREEGTEFAKALQEIDIRGVKVEVIPSVEHRAVVIFRGKGLSRNISPTDPHQVAPLGISKPLDKTSAAKKTAEILNEFTKLTIAKLADHPLNSKRVQEGKPPANVILCRGPGKFNKAETLEQRHGFRSACVSGAALYKGVAKYVGMDILDVPGATGRLDTDVMAKAKAARDALKSYDFVFIHIKGTDSASHDGSLEKKVGMIEKVDKMVEELLNEKDTLIAITADHSTPVSLKDHSGDPVPIAIYGPGVRSDKVQCFDELSCARGGLGHFNGLELMPEIVNLMGYAKIYGS